MFYTYAYSDPRTKLPFYIGKGKGNRWRSHLAACLNVSNKMQKTHFYHKLRKMLNEGVTPQIVKVFEGSERACFQTEMTLIQSYGRRCDGGLLCNHTLGGEGVSGCIHSLESRKKMSETHKTLKKSKEVRRKMSLAASNPSPETRQKLRLAALGRTISAETRQKMRLAALGKTHSAETKQKMSLVKKGIQRSPETIRRMSETKSKDLILTGRLRRMAQSQRKPVEAFDLSTGNVVFRFNSQSEVKKQGFHQGHVNEVVRGHIKSHKGLGWRYQNEDDK